ncbi:MAG: hypothetical protein QGG42_05060 [Phycisphaerae bacterium]|jgi:hypothetical protein|nr:hypothetical protein [Phycisphaerae bacterium]
MPDNNVQSDWTAPQDVGDHTGREIKPGKRFCWGPPPEIGRVLSAESNIITGSEPSFLKPWSIMLGLWIVVYLGLGEIMPRVMEGKGDPQIVRWIGVGVGLLCGLLSLLYTWPDRPQCTYVGIEGAAILSGRWGKPDAGEKQVVVFQDVTVLFASTTHMYKNLIYENTLFNFKWHKDASEREVMTIGGEHACMDQPPLPDNIYHFALRAEERWMEELIRRHGVTPGRDQATVFPCRKSSIKEVRLHADRIEFVYDQRVDSVAIPDLGQIHTRRGIIHIDKNDTAWFGGKGKFRVGYGDLGNAGLFLYYLGQLLQGDQAHGVA